MAVWFFRRPLKMLFYISRSIAIKALNNDHIALNVIQALIESRRKGHSLIFCHGLTSEIIIKALQKSGNTYHAKIFESIKNKFRQKLSLIKELNTLSEIRGSTNLKISKKSNTINIPYKFANNSNIFNSPTLLAENLNDCIFYENRIAKNYKSKSNPNLEFIKTKSNHESGGGNTINHSLNNHLQKNDSFCLCIVDSDKNAPECKLGQTALNVKKIYSPEKNHLSYLHIVDCYSAENLIPMNIIDNEIEKSYQHIDNKTKRNIISIRTSDSWKYLPLKKGIKCKELHESNATSNYWLNECMNNICVNSFNYPTCDSNCEKDIIPKIHTKTLSNSLNDNEYNSTKWNLGFKREDNPDILNNYETLSKLIKSWLCAGEKIIT